MDFYLLACGSLLAAGLMLNILDGRMFLLTAVVGAGFFFPVPNDTAEHFYTFCILAEMAVGLAAWKIGKGAGLLVLDISVLLVIAHVMGYALDGSPPFSPYRVIVKLLEISQLAVCVAMSPILAPILRNHETIT
jgi:hypothetical protein